MSDLVAIAYPDVETAQQVARNLVEAEKAHLVGLDDLVIVERQPDGKIKLHQPSLAGTGALGGAAWGGLIGLLFLVPIFGMAVGAASGAIAGHFTDAGVDDKFMKDLGSRLQDGDAALVTLVRNANMEKILADVKIPGTIIQTSLGSDTEDALKAALDRAGQTA
jgi:uncharacterized membrane protein